MKLTKPLYASFTEGTTSLCPYTDDTPSLFERWFADQEIVSMMGDWDFYPLPHYDQTPEEYVRRTRKTTWLICTQKGGALWPIGYTDLYIQHRHRVDILRLAIAEPEYRLQGHAKRAISLAIRWAFTALDLYALHAGTMASNVASVALLRSCGFTECGRYTLSRFSPEGRSDEIIMELLKEDWEKQNLAAKCL